MQLAFTYFALRDHAFQLEHSIGNQEFVFGTRYGQIRLHERPQEKGDEQTNSRGLMREHRAAGWSKGKITGQVPSFYRLANKPEHTHHDFKTTLTRAERHRRCTSVAARERPGSACCLVRRFRPPSTYHNGNRKNINKAEPGALPLARRD